MKKVFRIIFIILINLLLVFLALLIYFRFTNRILQVTIKPFAVDTYLFILLLIVSIILLAGTSSKIIKRFGVGLFSIGISSIIFLLFLFNKTFAREGSYKAFKLNNAYQIDNNFFLDIAFNEMYNQTEVTRDKCITVDSVGVRIDKGLFGMGIKTTNVIIKEVQDCIYMFPSDTNNQIQNISKAGDYYARVRCFTQAIQQYSTCIEMDSLNPKNYYNRGLIYLVKQEYRPALVDFFTASLVQYNLLSSDKEKEIRHINIRTYVNELLIKVSKGDSKNISDYVENLNTINDFDTYNSYMKFCLDKLKEK